MDKHDKDYFVPNFGVDRDIIDTHSNAGLAAKYCKTGRCGQPWVVAAQLEYSPSCTHLPCKIEES